mmetsp:Transcript_58745/g.163945  ORF Transcript_58745/g.163945 Transcript_58745/m.163945 type:complete len:105 (-) Transcript_58745:256-570(-)
MRSGAVGMDAAPFNCIAGALSTALSERLAEAQLATGLSAARAAASLAPTVSRSASFAAPPVLSADAGLLAALGHGAAAPDEATDAAPEDASGTAALGAANLKRK